MRYQIIKPIDSKWEEFGGILFELSKLVRKLSNETVRHLWEWDILCEDYKAEHGKYPMPKDVSKYNSLNGYIRDKAKGNYPDTMYAGNLSQVVRSIIQKWTKLRVEMRKGNMSIPSYGKDQPIHIVNNAIKISKDEQNNYYLTLNLISGKYKKELNRKTTTYTVLISTRDKTQRVILDRIMSGEYKQSASMILRHKNKWFVNLAYTFEPTEQSLDNQNIMGIDIGVVHPVYMAFNNSFARYKIDGGEIEEFRRRIERRRIQILNQRKWCGDGSRGHGRSARIKPIEKMTGKVANFRDSANHKYSRHVVDMAVKHNCGVIQMEDLSGISKDNLFLKNWSYYDLQQKIEYKAKEVGIEVRYIEPKYTSQRCSKCGHIEKDNREDQKTFVCKKCDFKANADYNAAKNIATKDIDIIIKEYLAANN